MAREATDDDSPSLGDELDLVADIILRQTTTKDNDDDMTAVHLVLNTRGATKLGNFRRGGG